VTTQPNAAQRRLEDVELAVIGWEATSVEGDAAANESAAVPATETTTVPPEVVFRLHYAPLAGWCRRMTGDTEVAHDIAAEAFVRLLARWGRVEDPRAYLYTTALNLVRDRWRKAERERSALRRTRDREQREIAQNSPELRWLIEALPRRHQQVIVLHYFADMTVDQVARTLGVAPGTIKRDLFDARATLQRLLEESA